MNSHWGVTVINLHKGDKVIFINRKNGDFEEEIDEESVIMKIKDLPKWLGENNG